MIVILMIFAAIAYFSIWPLIKKKQKRDIVCVTLLFLIALTVCLLTAANVHIPSLSNELANLLKSIGLQYPPLP